MDLSLYVITDEKIGLGRSHLFLAEEALKGGASVIQLRDKEKSSRELYRIGLTMREITHRYRALLIINDRLDIALGVGADGVHLGSEDLPVSVARRIAGKNFIIGASVTSVEEAIVAQREGADYISAQSIFPTSSKEDVIVIGLQGLREIVKAVSLPVIAIGGINLENAKEVLRYGAKGVAVISSVVAREDVKEAAASLKKIIEEASG